MISGDKNTFFAPGKIPGSLCVARLDINCFAVLHHMQNVNDYSSAPATAAHTIIMTVII